MHALAPIPDAVTKISCGYLDLISLGKLARASSRFHALVDAPDSDFAKIQIVAKKYRPRDLGLHIEDPAAMQPSMGSIGFNSRVVTWLVGFLLESNLHFLPDHLVLTNSSYVGRSSNRLFTQDRFRNFHVRDLQGNVLTTYKFGSFIADTLVGYQSCYELNPPLGRAQIALLDVTPKLHIWDITQPEAPQKVQEHNFEHSYPLVDNPYQFGNLLILIPNIHRGKAFPYTYDLSHPENPPRQLLHPKSHPFFCTSARNSNQFFILADARKQAIAYRIENDTAAPAWEADLVALGITKPTIMLANDRWLLLGSDSVGGEDNSGIITTFNLTILDAKTGEKRGAFSPSLLLTSMNPNHTLHIWGHDILVIKDEKILHMYQLPDGVPLPALEPESNELIQALTDTQELTLLYREKNTLHVRACTWTTPLDAASKVSLPAKAAPATPAPAPLVDPTFLENLYSCFAGFLSYFTDFWHWLRKLL